MSSYTAGTLGLDELITRTYTLDEIDVGDQTMRDGEHMRGGVVHSAG